VYGGPFGDKLCLSTKNGSDEYGYEFVNGRYEEVGDDPRDPEARVGRPVAVMRPPGTRGLLMRPAEHSVESERMSVALGVDYGEQLNKWLVISGWSPLAEALRTYGARNPEWRDEDEVDLFKRSSELLIEACKLVDSGRLVMYREVRPIFWAAGAIGCNPTGFPGLYASRYGKNKGAAYPYIVQDAMWGANDLMSDWAAHNDVGRPGSREKACEGDKPMKNRAVFQDEGRSSIWDRIIASVTRNWSTPESSCGGPTTCCAAGDDGTATFLVNRESIERVESADWKGFDTGVSRWQQIAVFAIYNAMGAGGFEWKQLCLNSCLRHTCAFFADPRGVVRELRGGNPSGRGMVSEVNSVANFLMLHKHSGFDPYSAHDYAIYTHGDDHILKGALRDPYPGCKADGWESRDYALDPWGYGVSYLGQRHFPHGHCRHEDRLLDNIMLRENASYTVGHVSYLASLLGMGDSCIGASTRILGLASHYGGRGFRARPVGGVVSQADVATCSHRSLKEAIKRPKLKGDHDVLVGAGSVFPVYGGMETLDRMSRSYGVSPGRVMIFDFPRKIRDSVTQGVGNGKYYTVEEIKERESIRRNAIRGRDPSAGMAQRKGVCPSSDSLWEYSWRQNDLDLIVKKKNPVLHESLCELRRAYASHMDMSYAVDLKHRIIGPQPRVVNPSVYDPNFVACRLRDYIRSLYDSSDLGALISPPENIHIINPATSLMDDEDREWVLHPHYLRDGSRNEFNRLGTQYNMVLTPNIEYDCATSERESRLQVRVNGKTVSFID